MMYAVQVNSTPMMHAMQICTLQGTAKRMEFLQLCKQRCAGTCDAKHHGVPSALLVTVFYVLKTELAIKAGCPP